MVVRAHVRNGQIVMDEPVALPEGAALSVVVDDDVSGEPKTAGGVSTRPAQPSPAPMTDTEIAALWDGFGTGDPSQSALADLFENRRPRSTR